MSWEVTQCAENLKSGTSAHDWPIVNLATGAIGGLCWFCGTSAEEFNKRVEEHGPTAVETVADVLEMLKRL